VLHGVGRNAMMSLMMSLGGRWGCLDACEPRQAAGIHACCEGINGKSLWTGDASNYDSIHAFLLGEHTLLKRLQSTVNGSQ